MSYDVYLSAPNVGDLEKEYVLDALDSGWVAPLGPHVNDFEHELASMVGVDHAVALSSGTAGLHLSLLVAGVKTGDEVVVPTLTFAATAFAVKYIGAEPVFIDSEAQSLNLDPELLADFLSRRAAEDRLPAAVIVVDVFGQTANYTAIEKVCAEFGVPIIEDAAEALGATFGDCMAGSFGKAAAFSFNGNKIITTSGGGMVVSNDGEFIDRVRYFATQTRQPVPWYEHEDVGYNYRLSNILAALGRAQLKRLPEFIAKRKSVRDQYVSYFAEHGGAVIQEDAPWGVSNSWLSVAIFDNASDAEKMRLDLGAQRIEARPLWKPMHMQPVFENNEVIGGEFARDIFERGLCLPSLQFCTS